MILHLLVCISSKRQETTSIGRDVEKKKDLCTFGGNVNWFNHYGKQFLKKVNAELPHDWSNNPISGHIFKDNENRISKRYLHSHVYRLLFTVAKIRKQFKCLSMDEGIKKMWDKTHTHTHGNIIQPWERYFAICDNTDGHWGHYAKRSVRQKKTKILYIMYMWNLRNNRMVVSRGW